jgi:PAS domain S-box-containing protein
MMDISEQVRLQQEREVAFETLTTLLESIPADVYVSDFESYEILYTNKHMQESFGEELTGTICFQSFRGETKACEHCTNDLLLDAEGLPTGTHTWDGYNQLTGRWYLNFDQAIRWVDGRMVRLQIATDITDLKQSESALRESEARYRAVLEAQPDLMFLLSDGGIHMDYYASSPDRLFVSPDRFIGKGVEETLPAEVSKVYMKFIKETLATNQTQAFEYQLNFTDGPRYYDCRMVKGGTNQVLAIVREITERVKAEVALRDYSERLEEMVEARTQELKETQEKLIRQERLAVLGELAGGVGHELRNPLGVITNAIYYINMALPEVDSKVRKYLQLIETEAKNAARIISDLLNFARVESVERMPARIPEVIVEIMEQYPAPEGMVSRVDIPEDLPQVYIDINQIKQVLINLVTNAYQAMSSQTSNDHEEVVENELLISASSQGDQVRLTIADTGHGIAPNNMRKIFEPLFTTKVKGIGLGLAISKKLVEANGGRIELDKHVETGAAFNIFLPKHE